MNLTIDLTPSEVAQLSEATKHTGLAPSELMKKLLKEHLLFGFVHDKDYLDAKLHKWQQQDGVKLAPDVPTRTLFAQWAEEDAQMTEQEREAEDRLWEKLEINLAENSSELQLRALS